MKPILDRHRVLFSIIIIGFFAYGCASQYRPLETVLGNQTYSADVVSIIPENEIKITIPISYPNPAGGGLIGLAVAYTQKEVYESRRDTAEKRVAPLRASSADIDFRSEYWDELEKALSASSWLTAKSIDKRPIKLSTEDRSKLKPPILILNTTFELSNNSQLLIVTTSAELCLKSSFIMNYNNTYFYISQRIGKEDEKDAKAIELWTANNGAAYRKAIAEGIEHNMFMLKIDLLKNLSNRQNEKVGRIKMNLPGLADDSRIMDFKGTEIGRINNHVLMRVDNSWALFSLDEGFVGPCDDK